MTSRTLLLRARRPGALALLLCLPPAALAAEDLAGLFEAAWARQPEARSLAAHRDAAQAQRRAAQAWTPGAPTLEAGLRSDRWTGDAGARELDAGLSVPLWRPGERARGQALAEADAALVESRAAAARWRVAGQVREAWWAWQRQAADAAITRAQRDGARRLADDVARREQAGELARADRHQAEAAVAAAQAALAASEAAVTAARLHLQALTGTALADAPPALPPAEPAPDAAEDDGAVHPALTEWADRARQQALAVALTGTQSRGAPELSLRATRERGAAGEPAGRSLGVALRLPLGDGARHDARAAAAQAQAQEALAQRELEQARLQAERALARSRVEAARAQLAALEHRARLARETRGFHDTAFRLGETDLPTRLRTDAEATEAERQAARARIDLAAALSAWRQALGLLPR
jgi:cobalt-zinc-cadmium efflux system outer membrane protein